MVRGSFGTVRACQPVRPVGGTPCWWTLVSADLTQTQPILLGASATSAPSSSGAARACSEPTPLGAFFGAHVLVRAVPWTSAVSRRRRPGTSRCKRGKLAR